MAPARPVGDARRPPPQHNLATAVGKAVDALRTQSAEQLQWLGAERDGHTWRLCVLNETLTADIASGRVATAGGEAVGPKWQVLVLHYLAVRARPADDSREVAFEDLASGRAYAPVYRNRVIGRLCAACGRDRESMLAAADRVGAGAVDTGSIAAEAQVFPRVRARLIWHAPDEEFPPSATLLLPGNIERYLCVEDIVVMSECLISRMAGRPF